MTFLQLALICLVALLGPVLSMTRRAPVPIVVAQLLVGVVLGASGLQVLDASDPTFSFLGEIGFALVMMVAGSHVPLRDPALRRGLRTGVGRAVLIGMASIPIGVGVAAWFGTGHAALYAVLFTSSSASLIMPVLEGMPLDRPAIVEMLPQVAIADAASIILLPLVIDSANAPRAAVGTLVVLLASVVVFLGLRWSERRGYRQRLHRISQERLLAVELRTSLVLLFLLAALCTAFHVSIMLAGFGLGLVLAALGEPRRLSHQLFALTEGLFAPVFFVWLGASLTLRDLAAHPSAITLGVALGVGGLAAHAVPALVTRQPWPVGLLTAAQLGVPIAAASLGHQLGVLAPGEDTALLLGCLVTIGATAVLSGRLRRIAQAPPLLRSSP